MILTKMQIVFRFLNIVYLNSTRIICKENCWNNVTLVFIWPLGTCARSLEM